MKNCTLLILIINNVNLIEIRKSKGLSIIVIPTIGTGSVREIGTLYQAKPSLFIPRENLCLALGLAYRPRC